jgi:hypothetical protein
MFGGRIAVCVNNGVSPSIAMAAASFRVLTASVSAAKRRHVQLLGPDARSANAKLGQPAARASKRRSKTVRYATFSLIVIAFASYVILFGREGLRPVLFFFPFTMMPFLVTALLAVLWRGFWTQVVLFVATLGYGLWFAYVYVNATILNPDPQGAIAFLFVGIYAAPVLVVLWLIAYAMEWDRNRFNGWQSARANE